MRISLYVNLPFNSTYSKKIIYTLLFLKMITNINSVVCRSKVSNSGLKIRKGTILGCKIILNKNKVYDFVDILFFVIIPQINNFGKLNIDKNGHFYINLFDFPRFFEYYNLKLIKHNLDLSILVNIGVISKEHSKLFFSGFQIV